MMEKYGIVVLFNRKNATNMAKLARDFDIPRTTLTATVKSKGSIISHFFLPEPTSKHVTANSNPK